MPLFPPAWPLTLRPFGIRHSRWIWQSLNFCLVLLLPSLLAIMMPFSMGHFLVSASVFLPSNMITASAGGGVDRCLATVILAG